MMKIVSFMIMLMMVVYFLEIKFVMIWLMNLIFIMGLLFLLNMNYSNFLWMMVYNWMGIDNFSMMLFLLVIWIIGLMFLCSIKFKNLKFYSMMLLTLMFFLSMSFISMNYFMFYLFFEMSLIPTFFLIMGWGYQPERINAGVYMLFYTMFASLPLLILLFYLYNYFNTLNYLILINNSLSENLMNSFVLYFYMIFAFLVKLPMFMFHLWLPKAHIEAPVTGSMILAAVMLKLGGYGIIRSLMFMKNLCMKFNYFFFVISLFGMIYLSLLNMRNNDFKLIVAYSSVVHMGMMLMGIMTMSITGFLGGFFMMIGHGFCSSALFFLVNVSYERSKSRNLLINKGLILFNPTLSMWWFMFCVINMSAPISLNLLSEIFILIALMSWSSKIFFLLFLGMYFSSMYSLYLFSYMQHGNFSNNLLKIYMNNINDYLILIIHWIPLNFMILKIDLFF